MDEERNGMVNHGPGRFFSLIGSHFPQILGLNAMLLLVLAPGGVCFALLMETKLPLFALLSWLLLAAAAPAFPAAAYLLVQMLRCRATYLWKEFWGGWREQFARGFASALCLGALGYLVGLAFWAGAAGAEEIPLLMLILLFWAAYLVTSFGTLLLLQYALIDAPALRLVRNTFALLFLCGWRGAAATLLQMLLLALLALCSVFLLPFLLGGLLAVWLLAVVLLLWPKLEALFAQ